MKFVPTQGKVLLQARKVYKWKSDSPHKKKEAVVDSEGNHLYDLDDFKVVETAVESIKKGKKVVTIFNGGVPIKELETKTHLFLVIDQEDIYAVSV